MSRDGFWDDPESAQKLMKEKKSIDDRLEELDKLGSQLEDLEVMVEMNPDFEFDAVRLVEEKQREIAEAIRSTLGISAKISLVSPKTIERSEGKAKRVIDKRKLYE